MSIDKARSILKDANRVVVLTGAGVSTESGIPTYRDEDGLWNKYRAEDFSSAAAFKRDPQMVWNWYHERRKVMRKAEPNAAHLALATLERQVNQFTLLTQNIDGLHQKGGSQNVVEMHGSIWKFYCSKCNEAWDDVPDSQAPWEALHALYSNPNERMPCCIVCNTTARPAVVWFGESLDRDVWRKAFQSIESCDCLIVIGTSAMVDPVASLVPAAKERGSKIIEINTGVTRISGIVDTLVTGAASEWVPTLIDPARTKTESDAEAKPTIEPFEIWEQDLTGAFKRGMEKFIERHPELREKLQRSGE